MNYLEWSHLTIDALVWVVIACLVIGLLRAIFRHKHRFVVVIEDKDESPDYRYVRAEYDFCLDCGKTREECRKEDAA